MADPNQVAVGRRFRIPQNSLGFLEKRYYIATVTKVLGNQVWGDWTLFTEKGVQVDVYRNHVCYLHNFESPDWEIIPSRSDKKLEDFL